MSSHAATKLAVLPKDLVSWSCDATNAPNSAHFLRLPHPRTGLSALFLPYSSPSPESTSTILEAQSIAPTEPRSWFMDDQVVSDGSLLILTRVDPVFLLIPMMQAIHPKDSAGHFRPYDDLFDEVAAKLLDADAQQPFDVVAFSRQTCVKRSIHHICETKDVTEDLSVYRYSPEKLLKYLQSKVARLSEEGIFEGSKTLLKQLASDGLMEDGLENLLPIGRTRAACLLVGHYIPPDVKNRLLGCYDFTALDEHVRKGRMDGNTLGENNSSNQEKGSQEKEQDTSKKRKTTKGSAGVERLKKVNTDGMAKLSSFFKKK